MDWLDLLAVQGTFKSLLQHHSSKASILWHSAFFIVQLSHLLGGSKITTDGDFNPEIKRCLLLGRKVMTNLDSILKSRDIALSTKVRLVKAMVFPVVMYGYESWTIKKAEYLSAKELMLKEETDRTGSILKAGLHFGPDCGL